MHFAAPDGASMQFLKNKLLISLMSPRGHSEKGRKLVSKDSKLGSKGGKLSSKGSKLGSKDSKLGDNHTFASSKSV